MWSSKHLKPIRFPSSANEYTSRREVHSRREVQAIANLPSILLAVRPLLSPLHAQTTSRLSRSMWIVWALSVKKAERRKIDAFELWCCRRLLRVSWTARRSNQSILKEISPGCSLEGLMLKLKLQFAWPPHAKSWLIGKDPNARRDWGQEEKVTIEDEMAGWHHRLNGHGFE